MKLFLIVLFDYFWVTHVSSCQTQNQVCKLCPKAQYDFKKESPVVKSDWTPGGNINQEIQFCFYELFQFNEQSHCYSFCLILFH